MRRNKVAAVCMAGIIGAGLCLAVTGCGSEAVDSTSAAEASATTEEATATGQTENAGAQDADASDAGDATGNTEEASAEAEFTPISGVEMPAGLKVSSRANGGMMIIKKEDSYGAADYAFGEVVPCDFAGYYSSPTDDGYYILRNESDSHTLFDKEGNIIYTETPDSGEYLAYATGSVYVTNTDWDGDIVTYRYYSMDGTLLLEASQGDLYDESGSFVDGKMIVYRNSYDYSANTVSEEIGYLYENGTVEWTTIYSGIDTYIDHGSSDSTVTSDGYVITGNGAGASSYFTMAPMNSPIGGYYIKNHPYVDAGYMVLCDEGHNSVADFNLCFMIADGEKVSDGGDACYNEENYLKGFFVNGKYLFNYGTLVNMVIDNRYYLVDLTTMETLGAYGYLVIDDNKYWYFEEGETFGYIDHEGRVMGEFEDATVFSNGYAFVKSEGVVYMINEDLEIVQEIGNADYVYAYGDALFTVTGDVNVMFITKDFQ